MACFRGSPGRDYHPAPRDILAATGTPMTQPRRVLIGLIVLALAANAAPGRAADPRPPVRTLAGELLVATTEMRDPRFAETVIYMVRHDGDGAQGFVVNRPLRDLPIATLLE